MKIVIEQRKDYKYGKYATLDNGKRYSIVNIKALMKSSPIKPLPEIFKRWEAIEIKDNGDLDCNTFFEAKTLKELIKVLLNNNIK